MSTPPRAWSALQAPQRLQHAVLAGAALLLALALLLWLAVVPALHAQTEAWQAQATAQRRAVLRATAAATALPSDATTAADGTGATGSDRAPATGPADFARRFPSAGERSRRVALLLDAAHASGLLLTRAEFRPGGASSNGGNTDSGLQLATHRVQLPLSATQSALLALAGQALLADPALALDGLRWQRGDAADGGGAAPRAELVFTWFMQAEPRPTALAAPPARPRSAQP